MLVLVLTVLTLIGSVVISGIATLMDKQTAIKGLIRVVLTTLFVFCLGFGWMVFDIATHKAS